MISKEEFNLFCKQVEDLIYKHSYQRDEAIEDFTHLQKEFALELLSNPHRLSYNKPDLVHLLKDEENII